MQKYDPLPLHRKPRHTLFRHGTFKWTISRSTLLVVKTLLLRLNIDFGCNHGQCHGSKHVIVRWQCCGSPTRYWQPFRCNKSACSSLNSTSGPLAESPSSNLFATHARSRSHHRVGPRAPSALARTHWLCDAPNSLIPLM